VGESEDKINTSFEIIRQENPRAATRGFSICVMMDTLISFAYTNDSIGESFLSVFCNLLFLFFRFFHYFFCADIIFQKPE